MIELDENSNTALYKAVRKLLGEIEIVDHARLKHLEDFERAKKKSKGK